MCLCTHAQQSRKELSPPPLAIEKVYMSLNLRALNSRKKVGIQRQQPIGCIPPCFLSISANHCRLFINNKFSFYYKKREVWHTHQKQHAYHFVCVCVCVYAMAYRSKRRVNNKELQNCLPHSTGLTVAINVLTKEKNNKLRDKTK